ncbi:MAG: putative lipoprotein [Flavipsychrobacter sp.]|nr:putative lipoprotein [Flavipsychrobacter sp.]
MRKLAIALLVSFCNTSIVSAQAGNAAMPSVLVYKTKGDFRNNVSVQLSADKKTIASYPDPSDLKGGDGPAPVKLRKGYLLDKRGVSWNTAFLKVTNVQYSKLPAAPSAEELYKMILEKDPMTELYNCGPRGKLKTSEINKLIDGGKLKKKCTPVKK